MHSIEVPRAVRKNHSLEAVALSSYAWLVPLDQYPSIQTVNGFFKKSAKSLGTLQFLITLLTIE
jgi:hypothetical protein